MNSSMYRATGLLAIKNELALAGLLNKGAGKNAAIALFISYVIIRSVVVVIANI